MIAATGISLQYETPGGIISALNGMDFQLQPGELVAVLGANGSGKSTLALALSGIITTDAGHISIDGVTMNKDSWEARRKVGVIFQNPDNQLIATSIEEEIAFGLENLGLARELMRERIEWALETLDLLSLRDLEPHQLSGGQKQRLAIAAILAMQPRYLILDEPTSMLDLSGRREVIKIIKTLTGRGHGILLITQNSKEALLADRIVVMSEGVAVMEGIPEEVFTRTREFEAFKMEPPFLYSLKNILCQAGLDLAHIKNKDSLADSLAEALCESR